MSNFFVLTHQTIIGPLTGVELREAALAGILHHECIIGASTTGPWYSASDIGLFSKEKVPLPHPDDVIVPRYHVEGMKGAFQGPFKLRELIGFASRGMLPLHAKLQVLGTERWFPVRSIRILVSCINGDLVLVDPNGEVVLRTEGLLDGEDPALGDATFQAPVAFTKQPDDDAVIESTERSVDTAHNPAPPPKVELATHSGESIDRPHSFKLKPKRISWDFGDLPRRAVPVAIALLVGLGLWGAVRMWNRTAGTDPVEILGTWVAKSDGETSFGVRFDSDGHCIVFNPSGGSWSGDYIWRDREAAWSKHASAEVHSEVDTVEPHHKAAPVTPLDGYLHLQGLHPPEIDGHRVRDLFVRRDGSKLMLGYLAEIDIKGSEKIITAGWISTESSSGSFSGDLTEELKEVRETVTERRDVLPLFQAIVQVREGVPKGESVVHETRVQSTIVDARYLLEKFGMPDEARRLFKFEIPKVPKGTVFEVVQLARYDDLIFMFNEDGAIEFLRIQKQS